MNNSLSYREQRIAGELFPQYATELLFFLFETGRHDKQHTFTKGSQGYFSLKRQYIINFIVESEIENYGSVKMIIGRDYETFSGLMLERYFKRVLIERQVYTRIGGWWDRKGENEIDIVAENELDDTATFFEVKRKAENIDMEKLEAKAAAFMRATGEFKGYSLSYKGLSMTDM